MEFSKTVMGFVLNFRISNLNLQTSVRSLGAPSLSFWMVVILKQTLGAIFRIPGTERQ